jgi:DivIVA domain-containing protein
MTSPKTDDPLAARRHRSGPARLTPETVRNLTFPRTSLGRRGYRDVEVERFRARVIDEIAMSDAELAELRDEIERLRAYFRKRAIRPVGRAGADSRGQAIPAGAEQQLEVRAVDVLSRAQQAADAHVAQAQDYARQLVAEARAQYEQIIAEADQRAARATDAAARTSRLTQAQLRSARDALSRELDRFEEPSAQVPDHPGRAEELVLQSRG